MAHAPTEAQAQPDARIHGDDDALAALGVGGRIRRARIYGAILGPHRLPSYPDQPKGCVGDLNGESQNSPTESATLPRYLRFDLRIDAHVRMPLVMRCPGKRYLYQSQAKTMESNQRSDRSVVFAGCSAIVLAVAEVALDLGTWVELDIAAIYGIPLLLAAFTRSRLLLWGMMVALVLAPFVTYALQTAIGSFEPHEALFVNRVLDAVALLLTAGLLHLWMASLDVREAQSQLLREQNSKLVAHEALIVQQNEELDRRRHEAEETNDRKTRVLNAVSHDIRNPVNAINLMADAIRRSVEDPAQVRHVPQMAKRLQANARSLVALVSEVLDIAHLDSGLLQRRESTFSLNEFIEAKCRDLEALVEAKSLQLRSEASQPVIRVRTDRIKLDRIITNLVMNAIKFTSNGGITVSGSVTDDGAAVIRVRDTGVGMAASELERIFDEFAQLDLPIGNPNSGWGLGLSICRRLANFIGASIGVESEPGQGSVFTVRLPAECVEDSAPVALLGKMAPLHPSR
jgi:signal transduction histidine kinase